MPATSVTQGIPGSLIERSKRQPWSSRPSAPEPSPTHRKARPKMEQKARPLCICGYDLGQTLGKGATSVTKVRVELNFG
eukprot:1129770-Amorphochlora_amoeboformis.AAC.1